MSRMIKTGYPEDIEVGTKADDGRVAPNALFISTTRDKKNLRALYPAEALRLAAAILETLSELPVEPGGLRDSQE